MTLQAALTLPLLPSPHGRGLGEGRLPSRAPRAPGWEAALAAYLDATAATRFAWGGHDCITFAACGVVAAGGPNIMGCIARPWNRRRAMLFVDLLGGVAGCVDALARVAGLVPVGRPQAMRGDLATLSNEGRPAAGIVLGAEVAIVAETGWQLRPRASIATAWGW